MIVVLTGAVREDLTGDGFGIVTRGDGGEGVTTGGRGIEGREAERENRMVISEGGIGGGRNQEIDTVVETERTIGREDGRKIERGRETIEDEIDRGGGRDTRRRRNHGIAPVLTAEEDGN